jgi:MFS family permease
MFLGAGFIAAAPLYAFVHVDRLQLSLSEVGFLGILVAGATTVAYLPWGGLSDRRGGLLVFQLGSAMGTGALFLYAWGPSFAVLAIAGVLTGFNNGAIEIGIQAVIGELAPPGERAAAVAGWSAANGVRGIIAPFVSTILYAAGIVDVTQGILLCACVSAVGAGLYAFAGRVPVSRGAVAAQPVEPPRLGA